MPWLASSSVIHPATTNPLSGGSPIARQNPARYAPVTELPRFSTADSHAFRAPEATDRSSMLIPEST